MPPSSTHTHISKIVMNNFSQVCTPAIAQKQLWLRSTNDLMASDSGLITILILFKLRAAFENILILFLNRLASICISHTSPGPRLVYLISFRGHPVKIVLPISVVRMICIILHWWWRFSHLPINASPGIPKTEDHCKQRRGKNKDIYVWMYRSVTRTWSNFTVQLCCCP